MEKVVQLKDQLGGIVTVCMKGKGFRKNSLESLTAIDFESTSRAWNANVNRKIACNLSIRSSRRGSVRPIPALLLSFLSDIRSKDPLAGIFPGFVIVFNTPRQELDAIRECAGPRPSLIRKKHPVSQQLRVGIVFTL